MSGAFRLFVALVILSVAVASGVAGAQTEEQSAAELQYAEERVEEQGELLDSKIEEISTVGEDLEDAQARVDGARERTRELKEQTGDLDRDLAYQQAAFEKAKARYEKRLRAAYKGGNLEGLSLLLDSVLGSSGGPGSLSGSVMARILFEGRESVEEYRRSRQILINTERQISQKRRDYRDALAEERKHTEELERRERELEESISRIEADKARAERYLRKLEEKERARILEVDPATGGTQARRGYELRVAKKKIVAEAVEPIPRREYVKLYKESAKKYGFARDWYILAAVGKVESNHGENMGPSSAGAMGPMQFLPSTWLNSGVDGDGDGVANIMDPEDAIPAAARYLRDGGAPEDWYAALFSYNHADWYVKKVLAVAEGYRLLAKDDRVGPYI